MVISLFFHGQYPPATSRHPAGPVCSSLLALGGVVVFLPFDLYSYIILSPLLFFHSAHQRAWSHLPVDFVPDLDTFDVYCSIQLSSFHSSGHSSLLTSLLLLLFGFGFDLMFVCQLDSC